MSEEQLNEASIRWNSHGFFITHNNKHLHKDGTWHKTCGTDNFHVTQRDAVKLIESCLSCNISEDAVNHPKHYTNHPSGVECITVTEHMNFNCGNAVKYIWRADLKNDAIEDLKKAEFYIKREIERRSK